MYVTSMKREEEEPLKCSAVYLDPKHKQSAPQLPEDCWQAFPLADPVPFDTRNLAKLTQAADPGAVILAVYPDSAGKLSIWGLIDQVAVHSQRLAAWETWRAEGVPGSFQVTVNGVADITVSRDLGILAALKQDVLVERYDDVLHVGPVCDYMRELASLQVGRVRCGADEVPEYFVRQNLARHLQNALCRVLLNIQKYKHGGALLIAGDTGANLNVKHGLTYDRLPEAVAAFVEQCIVEGDIGHYVYDHLLHDKQPIPCDVFRTFVRNDFRLRDCMSEMAGCVRFIGSLSRVDGLILMDRGLVVRGVRR
jgi:hypothetical protein